MRTFIEMRSGNQKPGNGKWSTQFIWTNPTFKTVIESKPEVAQGPRVKILNNNPKIVTQNSTCTQPEHDFCYPTSSLY